MLAGPAARCSNSSAFASRYSASLKRPSRSSVRPTAEKARYHSANFRSSAASPIQGSSQNCHNKLFLSGEDALIHVNPGVEFGDEWMPAYVAVANQKIRLIRKRSPSAPPYPTNGAFAWAIRLAKSKSLIWITSVLCGMQYLKNAKLEAYAPGGARPDAPGGATNGNNFV